MNPAILNERWRMIETDAEWRADGAAEVNSHVTGKVFDAVRYIAARMIGETMNDEERSAVEQLEGEVWEALRRIIVPWAAGIEAARRD